MSDHLYQRRGLLDAIVEIVVEYKWQITALVALSAFGLGGGVWLGIIEQIPEIPPWLSGSAQYIMAGSALAIVPAWYLVKRWYDPPGVPVVEIDPREGDYRILKIGPDLWEDTVVESPRETVGGSDDLHGISINGEQGVEILSLEVPEEGEVRAPVARSHWMAGATSADLRAYRGTIKYVRETLSARADRATQLRANLSTLVREASERVVVEIIRTAEEHRIANGDRIQGVVSEIIEDYEDGDSPVDEISIDMDSIETGQGDSVEISEVLDHE